MTVIGALQILALLVVVLALAKPMGGYLYRVFETQKRPFARILGPVERVCLRASGVDGGEQTWREYARSLLVFSMVSVVVVYAMQRLQGVLPLNPAGLPPPSPHLAFNTAVSFTTNTNWQAYGGETTMSYLTQMTGLAWQNFASAAAGLGVALAMARGLTRPPPASGPATVGSFGADVVRGIVYVLLPLSALLALALVVGGVVQTLAAYIEVETVEGGRQTLALGPAASQVAIKQLGTNGGGFFNVNSAHPFENPSPMTNFLQCVAILLLPAAQTIMFGRMARDARQGWVLLAAMVIMFAGGVAVCYVAEAQGNPALAAAGIDETLGNMEGKETRFGVASSALWATATTAASNGSVNAMHDSFTPLGGLVALLNIQLGEIVFGGVGAGLYGMLLFALLTVFLAGLLVGRTPEYLGKKIEPREMKLSMLYVIIFPLLILGPAAWAAVAPFGLTSLANQGPHGLSELLYAFSSAAGNNGSAFAGLNANTVFFNSALGIVMLSGRFLMIIPLLAIGGSMAAKRRLEPGPGTFPTTGPLFGLLLIGVIVIVGALTFFPALCLGPVVEHFAALQGRSF